jgi:hypothetical protein
MIEKHYGDACVHDVHLDAMISELDPVKPGTQLEPLG